MLFTLFLTLFAHDFWLEPATFTPAVGQRVGIRRLVGQDLHGDVVGSDSAVAHVGLDVLGYEGPPNPIEMAGENFISDLKDEGLDSIPRQLPDATVRELFSRCAKSLTLTGPAAPGQSDRQLGFKLELIAERNPYTMREGDEIAFRLLWESRPLPRTLIVATSKTGAKLSARSDANGRVRFLLPASGMWMIKAVHMIPAPAGANADWMSWWASETFEVPHAIAARK
jgi:uncharacterized GH25 family protein